MTATKARVIILWSHPRSCSTMFEMAFLQRKEFRVLHEPLGEPFYYSRERMSKRFSRESRPEDFSKYADLTFGKEWANITSQSTEGSVRTFVKDMASYIVPPLSAASTTPALPSFAEDGNPTVIPTADLLSPDVHHAFLIRTPEMAVPSYYKLCIPPKSTVTGFDFFDGEEVGIRESRLLYDWFVKMGQNPTIIDASDLLANPIEVMKSFCDSCDVPFDANMCEWEGGEQEHFKKWAGFHDDAQNSTGIAKPAHADSVDAKEREARKLREKKNMPEEVHAAIKASMADYEYLLARSKAQSGPQ